MRKNCWQIKQCGREPRGSKTHELGICPVAISREHDGINGGHHAGRYCWGIAGSFCNGKVQGTFSAKFRDCLNCDFLYQIKTEEGVDFRF